MVVATLIACAPAVVLGIAAAYVCRHGSLGDPKFTDDLGAVWAYVELPIVFGLVSLGVGSLLRSNGAAIGRPVRGRLPPMTRAAAPAAGIYVALVVSLATPLYSPLSSGRDDAWAVLILVAAVHLGLGAAITQRWVFALPIAVSLLAFLGGGAEGLDWMAIVVVAPALVALTAAGCAPGRAFERQADAIAVAFLVVALLAPAWAALERLRRGPHVPASIQRELPTQISLGNLCPGAETPTDLERDVRRRAEALIRELRRRPTQLVTYTYYYEDGDDEHRDITVRELAQEQLQDLNPGGTSCDPDLDRRLRAAM